MKRILVSLTLLILLGCGQKIEVTSQEEKERLAKEYVLGDLEATRIITEKIETLKKLDKEEAIKEIKEWQIVIEKEELRKFRKKPDLSNNQLK